MKILFSDLDGTLLNNDSQISDYTRQALDAMMRAGNILVLSSGRPLGSILEVMKDAGLCYPNTYIIAFNGSLIYDCDRQQSIYEIRLSGEDVSFAWQLAKEHKLHIHTYTDTSIVSPEEDMEIKFYRERIHLPLLVTNDPLSVMTSLPFKLLAIDFHEKKHLNSFSDALLAQKGDSLTTVFSSASFLEIISSKSGKGNALLKLCKRFSIPLQDTFAAGDARNDISMLCASGHAIAMKNGDPALFEHAQIITPFTNDEDGLAHVIMEYLT